MPHICHERGQTCWDILLCVCMLCCDPGEMAAMMAHGTCMHTAHKI